MTSVSVVIPYRSDEPERQRLFDWCVARWTALHPDWQLVTPHDGATEGPFNRARAVNRGVEMADGEQVIIADADIAVRHGQAEAMVDLLADAPWVVGYDQMVHLRGAATDGILSLPPGRSVIDNPTPPHRIRWQSPDSVCGLVALRRDDYLAVGGNDERFTSWGWEDTSFAYKADTLLGPHRRIPGDCIHLFHTLRPDRKTDADAQANRALGDRYAHANGDPEAMTALVREALNVSAWAE